MVVQLQPQRSIPIDSTRDVPVESLAIEPGQIAGLSGIPGSGLTRVGLSLLAPYASSGHVAYLDVRGWVNPAAAWEMGIAPERLVVVRTDDIVSWSRIVATLMSGMKGVYAEVPTGVRDVVLRKLAAKARHNQDSRWCLRPLDGCGSQRSCTPSARCADDQHGRASGLATASSPGGVPCWTPQGSRPGACSERSK